MNSKALQGLAAIAFVVGVLVTVPPYLNNLFAEDILVRVNRDEPTLPRELAQRLQEIPWEMDEFVYKFEPGFWNAVEPVYQLETENRDVIDSALKSALASIKNEIDNLARGLRIKTVDYASLGKLTIEVVNNSNMMIPRSKSE